MKIAKLLDTLRKKASQHWPDAKSVSVTIKIEINTYGKKCQYRIFSMAYRGLYSADVPETDIISFEASSVSDCISIFEQKTLAINKNEPLELE